MSVSGTNRPPYMPKYPFLSGSLLIIPPPEFDTMTSYYSTRERMTGSGYRNSNQPGSLNPAGLSAPYEGGMFSVCLTPLSPFFILQRGRKRTLFRVGCRNPRIFRRTMCDLNAYIYQEGKEELYLESVNSAKSEEARCTSQTSSVNIRYLRNHPGGFPLGHRIILQRGNPVKPFTSARDRGPIPFSALLPNAYHQ